MDAETIKLIIISIPVAVAGIAEIVVGKIMARSFEEREKSLKSMVELADKQVELANKQAETIKQELETTRSISEQKFSLLELQKEDIEKKVDIAFKDKEDKEKIIEKQKGTIELLFNWTKKLKEDLEKMQAAKVNQSISISNATATSSSLADLLSGNSSKSGYLVKKKPFIPELLRSPASR